MSTAEIREAAMKLSPEEKISLAEELLASLDSSEQSQIDAAWAEEAERRITGLDNGTRKAIPAEEVFRRIEECRR